MKINDMNWMQVEAFLEHDDRCILPLGSVEQHGYLSLGVDMILAERIAIDAADPLEIPVFPAVPYGLAPYFQAYPGSVTLRVDTYVRVVKELLDSMRRSGFRRILIINGHGGNQPAAALAQEYTLDHPHMFVKFHNWYAAPRTWAEVQRIDPVATHASWMENFPWTRLEGVSQPTTQKETYPLHVLRQSSPEDIRRTLGDGNLGGVYEKSDDVMLHLWNIAIEETREMLNEGWES